MIREQIKQLQTGKRELRNFGLLVGGVLFALALWWWWRGRWGYVFFLAPSLALMVAGAAWPRSLRYLYIGWMTLGIVMGVVVSTILLTLLFYFLVTPMGLIARLMRKDFLHRRLEPDAKTYWMKRKPLSSKPIERYEQQF